MTLSHDRNMDETFESQDGTPPNGHRQMPQVAYPETACQGPERQCTGRQSTRIDV